MGYVVPVVRVSGWSAFLSRVSRIGKVLLVVCAGVNSWGNVLSDLLLAACLTAKWLAGGSKGAPA